MGIAETIAAELRALRKRPGPLSAGKLARTPMILKGLGGGDVDEALARLTQMAASPSDVEEEAAYATIGFMGEGESVIERLDTFAAEHFIDQRTARRWSDAGIEKVAQRILSASPWLEPRLKIALRVDVNEIAVSLEAYGPREVQMYEPTLRCNDMPVELAWDDLPTTEVAVHRKSREMVLEDAQTAMIAARWRGNLEASYWIEVIATLPVIVEARTILRDYQLRVATQVMPRIF